MEHFEHDCHSYSNDRFEARGIIITVAKIRLSLNFTIFVYACEIAFF